MQPVITRLKRERPDIKISVDTYKAEVAEYAITRGFKIVNDVTSFRGDKKMIDVLLRYQPYAILMYSKDNTPRTTKKEKEYSDPLFTIKTFLAERIKILTYAGFPKNKIIIDPGMGAFVGSNPRYSFEIINRLSELKILDYSILTGISRKLFKGDIKERDRYSVEWSRKAVEKGANIIRIHNINLMGKFRKIVYLSLGSNIGNREDFLLKAIEKIAAHPSNAILKISSIYETEPWGMENLKNMPSFLNQCIKIETDLMPFELLEFLQSMEKSLGRTKKNSYELRTIDVDILLYGNVILHTSKLQLPHCHINSRKFVLSPLLEIEPSLQDPISGQRYDSILEKVKDATKVILYKLNAN